MYPTSKPNVTVCCYINVTVGLQLTHKYRYVHVWLSHIKSLLPGYVSWRRSKAQGSYYIQALCGVIAEHKHDWTLLQMLSRVSAIIAHEFESLESSTFVSRSSRYDVES